MGQDDLSEKQTTSFVPRRWVWLFLSLATLVAVVLFLSSATDTVDVSQIAEPVPLQIVSVKSINVQSEQAQITMFGEVKPRWSADIQALVAGRVTQVENKALEGESVDEGEALFRLEKTQYETDVANAELAVGQSKLALLKAQNSTELARRQFARDGTTPPNDLALHLPQLHIAELSVASAEKQLEAAQQRVSNTIVRAPFSGIVTERFVSLGQTVATGDKLIKLIDNRSFELAVELGRSEWDLVQQPISGQVALVLDQQGNPITTATVRQGGGFLNQATRQFRIFLDMKALENGGVFSGDFVRVVLQGRSLADALSVPESAVTREGYLWFVDENDQLRRHVPNILFRHGKRIVIAAPEGESFMRVAVTPLASFLPDQLVHAEEIEE